MNEEKIKLLEKKIVKIPMIDKSVMNVISLLENPVSTYNQILSALTPEITAKFLSAANSAFYGRQIQSIHYAIRILGYAAMKKILITSNLIDHFVGKIDLGGFDLEKFNLQSQFCAAISRILGEIVDYPKLEDLFTVSMLHNIGKLVIVVYFPQEYQQILNLKQTEGLSALDAELKIIGLSHAEIGAHILWKFNIPQELCQAIRYHESYDREIPEKSNFQLELILKESVHIVDQLVLTTDVDPIQLVDKLEQAIRDIKAEYKEHRKKGVLEKGFFKVFEPLLKTVAQKTMQSLFEIIPKRIV